LKENRQLLIYPQKGCEIHKERRKVAKKERNFLLLLALLLHLKKRKKWSRQTQPPQ